IAKRYKKESSSGDGGVFDFIFLLKRTVLLIQSASSETPIDTSIPTKEVGLLFLVIGHTQKENSAEFP
ncbi:3751_t:CDS:2, partial [Diversispora eburnea]